MAQAKINTSSKEKTNFLIYGNGIMSCYNLFPRQFKDISEMTHYLPAISEMGFNTVWINPIQKTGDVTGLYVQDLMNGVRASNQVSQSLYAMTDSDNISSEFLGTLKNKAAITQALKTFTDTARQYGLVPIFDLVLYHIASDSKLIKEHPTWFLKNPPEDFKDVIPFDYSQEIIREEIIREFWEPFLRKYILTYGFDGARVDAVDHIEPHLRQRIYELIHEITKEKGLTKPVILDESLFSAKSLEKTIDSLLMPSSIGPSHVIISTYFAQRDQYGGLPAWLKHEEGTKAQIVFLGPDKRKRDVAKGGCIAFTGNHDHNTLAMKVLQEMAYQRMASDLIIGRILAQRPFIGGTLMYSFVKDIERELDAKNTVTVLDFEYRVREKIAMCALTTSAGWYALSGDEVGDLFAKSVFKRVDAVQESYYPQRQHLIFQEDSPHHSKAVHVLKEMAIENILQEDRGGLYREFSGLPEAQDRLLVPYIENLQHQINSRDPIICKALAEKLKQQEVEISFEETDYLATPRTMQNDWQGHYDMRSYMSQVNAILKRLPVPKFDFWSEEFKLPSKPGLFIVVRKNGEGLGAETDLIIVNLSPDKPLTLTKEDIHQIACNFQQRVIGEGERHQGNPDFDLAYQSIMSCIEKDRVHTDKSIETLFTPAVPLSSQSIFKSIAEDNKQTTMSHNKLDK